MTSPLTTASSEQPNNQSYRLREALASCGAFFIAGRREADPLPMLRDLAADWLHAEKLEIIVPAGTGSLHIQEPGLLCGPIMIGRRVIGRIEARRSRPFSTDDHVLLGALGQILGAVLEQSTLQSQLDQHYHQAQANTDTLDRLLIFGRHMASASADPRHLAMDLVTQVPTMVTGERASLLLISHDQSDTPMLVLSNGIQSSTERAREVRDNGLAGLVLNSRAPMIIDETDTDHRWLALKGHENDVRTRCAMAVPLIWGEQLLGVLTVTTAQTHLFNTSQLNLLELVACHISLALHTASVDNMVSNTLSDMRLLIANARAGDVTAFDRMESLLGQISEGAGG